MADSFDYGWIADVADQLGIKDEDLTAISTLGYAGRILTSYMDKNAAQALYAKKQQFVSTVTSLTKMYQHATDNSIEPDKAKSSTLPINIIVYIDELNAAPSIDNTTDKKGIQLSEDIIFKVGNNRFFLDYPINVYTYMVNGVRKYYAQYDMSVLNPVSDVKNAIIPVKKSFMNGKHALALSVNVRDTIKMIAEIGYNDAASGAIFEVAYSNYLEHIEAKFKDDANDEYRTINTAMFFDKGISGETIFYMIKNGTVAFMNKYTGGNFVPTAGGRFKFTLYVTPITDFSSYTGTELSVGMTDNDTFTIDFTLNSGTVTGKKPPTLEELRTIIKNYKKTLNALISEDDVKVYLKTNGNENTMYNSYKYVDNFSDRIYNIVLRLGGITKIIPTNSIDIYMDEKYSDLYENGRYMVPKIDQKFILVNDLPDPKNSRAIAEEHFDSNPTYTGKSKDITYAIPFQLCYDRRYNFISAFQKVVNETRELLFSYIDSSSEVFVCTDLTYNFNVDSENALDYYLFRFNISTVDSDLVDKILNDPTFLHVYIELVNGVGNTVAYFKADILSYDHDTKTYAVEGSLRLTSPVYGSKINVKTLDMTVKDDATVVEGTLDLNDVYPRISIHVKDEIKPSTSTKFMTQPQKRLLNVFDIYRDVLNPDDGMLFKEISTYIPTQINTKYMKGAPTGAYDTIEGVVLDKVPVVKYGYYYKNQDTTHALIDAELALLDTLQGKVDGLFKTRLNFVNSYGQSQLAKIGLKGRSLGKTHIVPNITIGMKEDSTLTKDTVASFINAYFTSINFKNGDVFYFSNLSKAISAEYSDVVFVQLNSINGETSDIQKIYMDAPDNVKFISEVVNIARNDNDDLAIELEFVYE